MTRFAQNSLAAVLAIAITIVTFTSVMHVSDVQQFAVVSAPVLA